MSSHIHRDEMIQHLYGLDIDQQHLASCPECLSQFQALQARNTELTRPEEVSGEFLAAQRRAVYSRMRERPRTFHAWVPALATAALVALGVYVYQPAARPAHPHAAVVTDSEVGDAQLFSEAVSIEQTAEPRALAPMHGLFQGNE